MNGENPGRRIAQGERGTCRPTTGLQNTNVADVVGWRLTLQGGAFPALALAHEQDFDLSIALHLSLVRQHLIDIVADLLCLILCVQPLLALVICLVWRGP
jgi:hypothetical protein